ncbi:MAG: glycosyltransferase family 4 protein [Nostoc sp. ChiQUE01a]|nr:glycosyltransferase family 4 protein [Nostoc sp. ChiQUE01a]
MKILFLTTIILSKNCNGGEVASQCFINALRNLGHQVTVIGYLRKGDKFEHNPQETLIVDERYTETSKTKLFLIFWLIIAFLKGLPYSSAKYYSRNYIALVKKLLIKDNYDAIVIDHAQLGWIERLISVENKLITIAHNVEYQIYEDIFQKANNFISKFIYRREANLIKVQEEHLLNASQQVWTLTEHDQKYFSNVGGLDKVRTFGITPGFTTLQDKAVSKCFDIGLLGSWIWKANREALQWFIEDIYPYLPTDFLIHIAGKGADWLTNKYPNIYYCGVVPDAQEFMAQARVIAIPTLSGGGIQIKTLDAIASGSCIVATPVALRGISYLPSTVQIAEKPQEFANFLISAVSLPFTQKAFEEAKDWYHIRQAKFIHDIAYAINDL